MKKLFILFILLLVISCKKEIKANDNFRKTVIANIDIQKDTLLIFNKLLDNLDKNNITFCEYFNHTHYEIQDSCSQILNKKYENIDIGTEYYDEHYLIVSTAINKYEKKLAIDESVSNLAQYVEVTNDAIKSYCLEEHN